MCFYVGKNVRKYVESINIAVTVVDCGIRKMVGFCCLQNMLFVIMDADYKFLVKKERLNNLSTLKTA